MPRKDESEYVLYVSNLSSSTRSRDVKDEFHRIGRVYKIERDYKSRSALVEMDRADDADYAYRKIDGFYMDGREWRVDYATKSDFEFYGWKWSEGGDDANRSPSRSASPQKEKASERSRSRSPSPHKSAGSHSPTTTRP